MRMSGAMVTLGGNRALYLGGASDTVAWIKEDDAFELKSDLSGWEERPDLRLPWEVSWISAAALDL